MISKSLSTSERFAALNDVAGKLAEFCQTIYPLLLAHADDWGCQQGDTFTVKHAVFPTSPRKLSEFSAALVHLHNVGLTTWYEVEGKRVVYIRGFAAHQNLKGHESRKRQFPAPPEIPNQIEEVAQKCPTSPNLPKRSLREQNLTEPKRTELNLTQLAHGAIVDDGFEHFWRVYPKKKSKADAEKAWRKLAPSPELLQRILASIAAQLGSTDWLKDGGQYIPFPASWLNARRWEDGPDSSLPPPMSKRTLALAQGDAAFLGRGQS